MKMGDEVAPWWGAIVLIVNSSHFAFELQVWNTKCTTRAVSERFFYVHAELPAVFIFGIGFLWNSFAWLLDTTAAGLRREFYIEKNNNNWILVKMVQKTLIKIMEKMEKFPTFFLSPPTCPCQLFLFLAFGKYHMASKWWRALENKSITSFISVPKVSQKHKLISVWKIWNLFGLAKCQGCPKSHINCDEFFEIALLALTAY